MLDHELITHVASCEECQRARAAYELCLTGYGLWEIWANLMVKMVINPVSKNEVIEKNDG